MSKQSWGRVYKLVCGDHIYVGSTKLKLDERLQKHVTRSNQRPNQNVYKFINENGGWDGVTIEEVEPYMWDDEYDEKGNYRKLRSKEGEWFDKMKGDGINILNVNRPFIENYDNYWTEWHAKRPNYRKEYYENHKEQFRAYGRKKIPCPRCGKSVGKYYLKKHMQTSRCLSFTPPLTSPPTETSLD